MHQMLNPRDCQLKQPKIIENGQKSSQTGRNTNIMFEEDIFGGSSFEFLIKKWKKLKKVPTADG